MHAFYMSPPDGCGSTCAAAAMTLRQADVLEYYLRAVDGVHGGQGL